MQAALQVTCTISISHGGRQEEMRILTSHGALWIYLYVFALSVVMDPATQKEYRRSEQALYNCQDGLCFKGSCFL